MGFNSFPCNPYPISTEELNKGNNDALNTRVTALEESVTMQGRDIADLNSNKANQITIAPFFNAETAYEVGDLVYYNGLSYRCTNAHRGEWDADDFAATTISNELSSLMSGLIKSLTTSIELTTDADGNARSDTMSVLHPGKNILAVILNYNYMTSYSGYHAKNIWFYPIDNTIFIQSDELKSVAITVFYTLLYTDS